MDPVAFDYETCCFAPGLMAPPPVCASTYHPQDGKRIWVTDELHGLMDRLLTERTPILTHGGSYDHAVTLEWFPALRHKLWAKFERNEMRDSLPTERIIEISTGVRGGLKLDVLAARYGVEVTKSCVQTDFGRYLGRPLSEYTAEHKRYVIGDTAELWTLHQRQWSRGIVGLADLGDLMRSDFWLRLCSNYGIRTDPERVDVLERETQAEVEDLTRIAWGLDADGTRIPGFVPLMREKMTPQQIREGKWYSKIEARIKDRVLAAYGGKPPRTDGWDEGLDRKGRQTDPRGIPSEFTYDPYWGVSMAKTTLEESGDPVLEDLARLGELIKVRNADVVALKRGVHEPIHTRFGFTISTRTTSSGPNLQNFRKKRGIRECLLPRPGCCFVETDYPSLELFAVAQVCKWKLGRTDLVGHMNNGRDYHAVIAEGIFRSKPHPTHGALVYDQIMALKGKDEIVKAVRDCGKYGNYGLLGFMSDPETFQYYVNNGSRTEENPRGLQWTKEQAAEVMADWRRVAHDPVAFLGYVATLKNSTGFYDVEIPGTGIILRGATRTTAANVHFQGLGAVIARRAGWKLAYRQYIARTMPARTVNFVHDAFLGECKLADRDECARHQEECMAEALTEVCPDMRIYPELEAKRLGLKNGVDCCVIDSAAQDHYSKYSKSKRDSAGRLIVCQV